MCRAENARDHSFIGSIERFDKRLLKDTTPACLGTGFKNSPDPGAWTPFTNRPQGLLNSRRMVGKVVVDSHALDLAAKLQPSLDTLKARESTLDRRILDAQFFCRHNDTQRILHVKYARHWNAEAAHRFF